MRHDITFGIKVPRALWVRFPLGNPFGEPNEPEQHHLVLETMLQVLETAVAPTFVEFPVRWRRWAKWL